MYAKLLTATFGKMLEPIVYIYVQFDLADIILSNSDIDI